jgi:hypothetical protein
MARPSAADRQVHLLQWQPCTGVLRRPNGSHAAGAAIGVDHAASSTPGVESSRQERRCLPARAHRGSAAARPPAAGAGAPAAGGAPATGSPGAGGLLGAATSSLQGVGMNWRDREMRARERDSIRITESGVEWGLHVLRKMKTLTKFAKSRKRAEIPRFERIHTSCVIF